MPYSVETGSTEQDAEMMVMAALCGVPKYYSKVNPTDLVSTDLDSTSKPTDKPTEKASTDNFTGDSNQKGNALLCSTVADMPRRRTCEEGDANDHE